MVEGERSLVGSVQTNMRILKPTRKKPRLGDVFVLQMPDDKYSFGRVVSTSAMVGGRIQSQLIYVFEIRSASKDLPARSELRSDHLLVPPMMTNLLPWSRGYLETIAHLPFEPGEVLSQHCFYDSFFQKYVDELGNDLPGPVEPVGELGLQSFRTIDDAVSAGLGIPLVPEG
ncbi:Imm26 family immunity protein [Arthrobacter sp. S2(2024)]|uniref:Imm26 family immunity protein n=1 Tax=Arthrobacter sp. S2(2024) TaxID=3111911 RepID=UPI002FC712FD